MKPLYNEQALPFKYLAIEYWLQVDGGRPIKCPATPKHREAYFRLLSDCMGLERADAERIMRNTILSYKGVNFWMERPWCPRVTAAGQQ